MRPKGMKNLATFNAIKVMRAAAEGRERDRVLLCRRTERVEVKGSVIPMSLVKIKERGIRWGGRAEKEGQLVELVGDQGPSPEAPPWSKRGGSSGDVKRGVTA